MNFTPKNNSVPSAFFNTIEKYKQSPALRYRNKEGNKETLTFIKLHNKVNIMAKALESIGAAGKHVSIFSENRVEWFIVDMALLSLSAVDVPRGNDSTKEELKYILEHSDSEGVVVENKTMYEKIKDFSSKLKFIVVLDGSYEDKEKHIYSFNTLMELGEKLLNGEEDFAKKYASKINPDNIATIIYTSGTTGRPKGVVLTHKNILHNIETLPPIINLQAGEKFLSVLPIWHIYERTISYLTAIVGCFTVITTKANLKIDLAEEKPDIFVSVPAIWVNIYRSVMKAIDKKSPIAKALANFLIKHSIKYIRHQRYKNDMIYLFSTETKEYYKKDYSCSVFDKFFHKLAQKIVYKNIINLTGGRLRITISGGGALPMYIEDFLEACGINLGIGWGITETAPVVTLRNIKKNIRGTCGEPVLHVDIEIRDKDGEKVEDGIMGVCFIKGPNVFKEYYKDEKMTQEAKGTDGYFNSGDLGAYTKDGSIVLTGRAKETIVLLTGENVEPQPIENKILESPFISQVMLIGQDKPSTGAIIVIDEESIRDYFHKHKIDIKDEDLHKMPEVTKLIKDEIAKLINAETGFRPYESISKFIIIKEPFRIENEFLTQSLKIKRNEVSNFYKDEIENIYK